MFDLIQLYSKATRQYMSFGLVRQQVDVDTMDPFFKLPLKKFLIHRQSLSVLRKGM